jgi:hypothetical protein
VWIYATTEGLNLTLDNETTRELKQSNVDTITKLNILIAENDNEKTKVSEQYKELNLEVVLCLLKFLTYTQFSMTNF